MKTDRLPNKYNPNVERPAEMAETLGIPRMCSTRAEIRIRRQEWRRQEYDALAFGPELEGIAV